MSEHFPGTVVLVAYGDLSAEIAYADGMSPDMVDHALTRARREVVAAARQLDPTPVETEAT